MAQNLSPLKGKLVLALTLGATNLVGESNKKQTAWRKILREKNDFVIISRFIVCMQETNVIIKNVCLHKKCFGIEVYPYLAIIGLIPCITEREFEECSY